MRKISFVVVAVLSIVLASCGLGTTGGSSNASANASAGANAGGAASSVLGGVLSAVTNGQTVGNVLQSVLGLDKLTQKDLIGTWSYTQPGCAFTSQQLLAQAGGEAVATSIKEKMIPAFQKVGVNASNTQITFNEDGTFSAKIAGKSLSGKYTFDESTYKVSLQTLLLPINCYAKKNVNGVGLLFEASKLLSVLQTVAAMSGNSTLSTIGDLSKNYDGLRLGFEFAK